jgi:NADH-quinone oxidoreductase subunit A
MNNLLVEYLPVAVFMGVSAVIALALLVVPFLVAPGERDVEKNSTYECGFEPFDDSRMTFDARFYLVAILFIVFDLEAIYLYPWALTFREIGDLGFWTMMIFIAELVVGFIYAWRKGALEWD